MTEETKKRGGVRKKLEKSRGLYNASKYKGLDPEINNRKRYDEISDMASYAHTLSEEDKQWLNKFSLEYVCADFRHDNPIHSTKELERSCYTKNNKRNSDIFTRKSVANSMVSLEEIREQEEHSETNISTKEYNEDLDDYREYVQSSYEN